MKDLVYLFLRGHSMAVNAKANGTHQPEAALIGSAFVLLWRSHSAGFKLHITPITFYNPKVALVIGWNHETTVKYQGILRSSEMMLRLKT